MVSMSFGEKILREAPIPNPHLSGDARQFEAEYSLFLEHCAWRIENQTQIICGSTDDNSNDGPMVMGLRILIGRQVEAIELSPVSCDLLMSFSSGVILRVFCDQLNMADEFDNYTFFQPNSRFVVGTHSRLSRE